MPNTQDLPVLESAAQARAFMQNIFETRSIDVSVFVDRGWGDQPVEYTVIVDGNGQEPLARITGEAYRDMLAQGVIQENNLRTHKARKNHQFLGARWAREALSSWCDVSAEFVKLKPTERTLLMRRFRELVRSIYSGKRIRSERREEQSNVYEVACPSVGKRLTVRWYPGSRFAPSPFVEKLEALAA